MRVLFNLHFQTEFGQELILEYQLCGSNLSGSQRIKKRMSYENRNWSTDVFTCGNCLLKYRYRLTDGSLRDINEAGQDREIVLSPEIQCINSANEIILHDEWRAYNDCYPFYSSAFTEILYYRVTERMNLSGNLIINVHALNLESDKAVIISGDCSALGNWEPLNGLNMQYSGNGVWSIAIDKSQINQKLEYKFLIKENQDNTDFYTWEDGMNRIYINNCSDSLDIINHNIVKTTLCLPRIAGTAIPLFSLRGENSTGIGDIGDLFSVVDLLHETGQNILQLLPVNDTTAEKSYKDSYPYNSISVFALNPVYLNLKMAGEIRNEDFLTNFNTVASSLEKLPDLDYSKVYDLKWSYITQLYHETGEIILNSEEYLTFFNNNSFWLEPYAIFCFLRDKYQTSDFRQWQKLSVYNKEEMLLLESADVVCNIYSNIVKFSQFLLDKQFRQLKSYAQSKKVILKGDLPIGVNRNSVDAWVYPNFFNFELQTGAPPDSFSKSGQNWGFPTYNWQAFEEDGYSWWRNRLKNMSIYFDSFRIDHVLGFFRIWEIPLKFKEGLNGNFNPTLSFGSNDILRYNIDTSPEEMVQKGALLAAPGENNRWVPAIDAHNSKYYRGANQNERISFDTLFNDYFYRINEALWSENGFNKLQELLSFSGMLACSEDLGMIPDCVPKVLSHFRTLTLEIERFPKKAVNEHYTPSTYPYFSVCTTGTHDTSTLRGWLDELSDICVSSEKRDTQSVLRDNLRSPSLAAIFPLQDWFVLSDKLSDRDPQEERINIPSDPDHIWKYRIHKTIEEIATDNLFKDRLRKFVFESGRGV